MSSIVASAEIKLLACQVVCLAGFMDSVTGNVNAVHRRLAAERPQSDWGWRCVKRSFKVTQGYPLCQSSHRRGMLWLTISTQIPPFKLPTVGGRAFPVAAARFWNRLPYYVTSANSLSPFQAATETHSVPAVIPRHYPATFLNCNTHSGPSSGIAT